MSRYRTISHPDKWGHTQVVRETPSVNLDGVTLSVGGTKTRNTSRKTYGAKKAEAIELRLMGRIDRKRERSMQQRAERRAKRK